MREKTPGWVGAGKDEESVPSQRCRVSGCAGELSPAGVCDQGMGFPEGFGVMLSAGKWHSGPPEVCNYCRGQLEWSGKCYRCWYEGQRETIPGHEYLLRDGHWVRSVAGPRPINACGIDGCTMSLEQHRTEGLRAIREMLAAVTGPCAR